MYRFGEWLPDQPAIGNPGLTEAKNTIPIDGTYQPLSGLNAFGNALTARCLGGFATSDDSGNTVIYAADATKLYRKNGSSWDDVSGATYTTGALGFWRFGQYNDTVIATNLADAPQKATVGSGNFSNLAAGAPKARTVGVIRDFTVLGDLNDATYGVQPHAIHWSAIGDPTDFPTPFTTDAASKQSSREELDATYGAVQYIANGEQYGLVFQRNGIVRLTYVGGATVFQIQTYERARGALTPQGNVQVGNLVYYLAQDGFYVTDGIRVTPIGDGKVDKWFFNDFKSGYPERVTAAVDLNSKVIIWSYPGSGSTSGTPNKLIFFNYVDGRWGHGDEECELIFPSRSPGYTLDELDNVSASIDSLGASLDSSVWAGGSPIVHAFDTAHKLSQFTGAAKDAVIETGEVNLNEMGRAYVSGVKPIVSGHDTLTVQLGYRDDQEDGVVWTQPVAVHSRTRTANFRNDAFYHRARINITGGFSKAVGLQFDMQESGMV